MSKASKRAESPVNDVEEMDYEKLAQMDRERKQIRYMIADLKTMLKHGFVRVPIVSLQFPAIPTQPVQVGSVQEGIQPMTDETRKVIEERLNKLEQDLAQLD